MIINSYVNTQTKYMPSNSSISYMIITVSNQVLLYLMIINSYAEGYVPPRFFGWSLPLSSLWVVVAVIIFSDWEPARCLNNYHHTWCGHRCVFSVIFFAPWVISMLMAQHQFPHSFILMPFPVNDPGMMLVHDMSMSMIQHEQVTVSDPWMNSSVQN